MCFRDIRTNHIQGEEDGFGEELNKNLGLDLAHGYPLLFLCETAAYSEFHAAGSDMYSRADRVAAATATLHCRSHTGYDIVGDPGSCSQGEARVKLRALQTSSRRPQRE